MPTESITSLDPNLDPKYEISGGTIPDWIVNEAFLINEAIDKGAVSVEQAQLPRGHEGAIFENKDILRVMRGLVEPCLYVEYPPENLGGRDRGSALLEMFKSKFKDGSGREWELGDYLAANNDAVSICMSSLDETTAETVRYLNDKHVPVVAWVVVDDAQGYWTNRTNIRETALKTDEILKWAEEHKLRLKAVGFDSEKPVDILANIAQANIVEMAKAVSEYRRRVKLAEQHGDPQVMFDELLRRLNDPGIQTEAYVFPRGLKALLGGVAVNTPDNKRIVEMVYTNGIPAAFQGAAFKLLKSEDSIPAFGIVSGDDNETPGRDFARISEATKADIPLEEAAKGKLPKHLSEEELTVLIDAWLDQEIDVNNRVFKMRELYLFAMNNARVALALSSAMDKAFERQGEKHK